MAKKDKLVGASLEAEVTLYVSDSLMANLAKLEDELRFVLITSVAELKPLSEKSGDVFDSEVEGLFVAIKASEAKKCERCWHYTSDVGQHEGHDDLCGRCVENVDGQGEQRKFA